MVHYTNHAPNNLLTVFIREINQVSDFRVWKSPNVASMSPQWIEAFSFYTLTLFWNEVILIIIFLERGNLPNGTLLEWLKNAAFYFCVGK